MSSGTTGNASGYVMTIHNDTEAWSSRSAADVVLVLELGSHDYFVVWPEGRNDLGDASDQGGPVSAKARGVIPACGDREHQTATFSTGDARWGIELFAGLRSRSRLAGWTLEMIASKGATHARSQ
jgi:hypothetical protein